MALDIPVGFAEAIIPITNSASSHVATVTFGVDVTGAGGDYAGVADSIMATWDDTVSLLLDSACVAGPVALSVGQDGGPPLSVVGSTTAVGTSVHVSLPPNCALLVKKSSATAGRRGRGRFFVPWVVSTSQVDEGGHIGSVDVAGFTSAFAGFLSGLEGDTAPMVLLHSPGISTAGDPSPVTSLIADRLIATQRRRLGR